MAIEIAQAARSGPARLGTSRLITIDGPAGSGKSTLAHRLVAELGRDDQIDHRTENAGSSLESRTEGNRHEIVGIERPAGRSTLAPTQAATNWATGVAVIHLDDLYEGWTGLDSMLFNRLEAWIILPLANSLPARFLAYDWVQARFARWVEVPPARYVIIEGVGAGDAVTREWATTKVWLDVTDESGRRRGLARDSTAQQTPEARRRLREQWSLWQTSQSDYFADSGNRAAADFRIDMSQS